MFSLLLLLPLLQLAAAEAPPTVLPDSEQCTKANEIFDRRPDCQRVCIRSVPQTSPMCYPPSGPMMGCVCKPGYCRDYLDFQSTLELESSDKSLVPFPLLNSEASYSPDTVDLTQDEEARNYWLTCFSDGIDKVVKAAINSQKESRSAPERALNFKQEYLHHLNLLAEHPL